MTRAGLPDGLEPLLDVEQLRATDAWAIEERDIPGVDLMERAGEGLFEVVWKHAPPGEVVVVCGGGNNGGDGYAVARLLRLAGRSVSVLHTSDPAMLSGDAAVMRDRLPGEPAMPFAAGALDGAAVIVDAILGTGFSGSPRDHVADAIAAINGAEAFVVAADVPSRRRRRDRRGRRRGGPCRHHRDLPCGDAGPVDRTGQGACGRGRRGRHRDGSGGIGFWSRPAVGRLDRRRRPRDLSAAGRGVDEVRVGPCAGGWRGARG